MNNDILSPRHRESPLTRRTRDIPPSTTNCLEVQWRFLQHKNPKPPEFQSLSRKLLIVDPLKPQIFFNNTRASSNQPDTTRCVMPRSSPSRLFHMFEAHDVEAEDANTLNTGQIAPQQVRNLPESPRASRTLNDLIGETQRQAMLDRILADMEYLAVEPTYSRLGEAGDEGDTKVSSPRNGQRARSHKPSILQTALRPEPNTPTNQLHSKQRKFTTLWSLGSRYSDDMDDDDDDDSFDGMNCSQPGPNPEKSRDRKRRQRRKLQQFNQQDDGPRIFWQQTTGARSAADVPERLLTLSPSPPRRMRSVQQIVLGRRSYTSRQLLSASTTTNDRQRSKDTLIVGTSSSQQNPQASTKTSNCNTLSPRRRRRHNVRVLAAPTSSGRLSNETAPVSPPKARYGAWYVPQSRWWTQHQIEQQSIANKFPALTVAPATEADEPHCHGNCSSPTLRQHKPSLPPAALSPRSNKSVQYIVAARTALQAARASQVASSGGACSRIPSASSRSDAAPPSAPGPLELQVAGIPHSYIGREYRAYIISTGSAMPQYLK